MAEHQGQFHTRTTVLSQTQVQPEIRYDPIYFQTVPGLIKIILIIFNLVGFLCIQISSFSYITTGEFFSSIAMIGFWFTGILLVLYVFHVLEKFYVIPWLKVELIFNAIWTLMYLIAATCAATISSNWFIAAAFCGYCAMVVYGYDTFAKYRIYRVGGIAQGTRTVTQQQQQVTSVVVK